MFTIDDATTAPIIVGIDCTNAERTEHAVFSGLNERYSYTVRAYYQDFGKWVEADCVRAAPSKVTSIVDFTGPLQKSFSTRPTTSGIKAKGHQIFTGPSIVTKEEQQ